MSALRPTREILEDALVADPDDLTTHSAYADLLIEEGDARGEFIQTQLQLEVAGLSSAMRSRLRRKERQLLLDHQATWLGPLDPFLTEEESRCRFTFRRGWLDELTIPVLTVQFARVLRIAPETRLLRRLINIDSESEEFGIDFPPGDDVPADDSFPSLHAMRGAPFLTNVRYLQLGDRITLEGADRIGHGTGDGLVAFLPSLPRLEELITHAYSLDARALFEQSLKGLQVLEVSRGFNYDLTRLARNSSVGSLRRLVLQPAGVGETTYGTLTIEGISHLCRSRHLKALRELGIRGDRLDNSLCEVLVRSNVLKRLTWLDLSGNQITDTGADILAGCPAFAQISSVNLHRNQLTAAGIERLKAVNPRVEFGRQGVAMGEPPPQILDSYDEDFE